MMRVKSSSACGLVFGWLLVGSSCSDTTNFKPIPLAKGCEVEADCDSGLTCTKRQNALGGLCHQDCTSSNSCAIGDRCVHAEVSKTGSTVCQPASEALCKYDSDCFVPLKCGPDQQCRDACKQDYDCIKPQICTNQHFCAEPYEVTGNRDLIVGVGGEGGAAPPSVTSGGGGGGGTTGGGVAGGGGGTSGSSPTSPGGVGPADAGQAGLGGDGGLGGEAGLGGVETGGAGGSGGLGPPPKPCELDNSSCNSLTVVLAGNGSGRVTSDPGGVDCGDTCSEEFPRTRAVVLKAFPGQDSVFNGWSGGGCAGDGNCMVTPDAPLTITATFSSLEGPVTWIKTQPHVTSADAIYDPDGNVIITGTNTESVNLGGMSEFGAGTFIVKYTGAGNYRWGIHFVNSGASAIATDQDGNITFAGVNQILPGSPPCSTSDIFAKFDKNGILQGEVFCGSNLGGAIAIAATGNGDLVFSASQAAPQAVINYARLAGGSGATIWSGGGVGAEGSWGGLALDAEDNIFVGGSVRQGSDFPGLSLGGGVDGFIMMRDSAGGFKWMKTFGGTEDDYVLGLATRKGDGSVGFTGRFRSHVQFPNHPPFDSVGGDDIVIGRYWPNGELAWVKPFGSQQDEAGNRITALANGDFLVSGTAHSSLDFGGGPLFFHGKQDVFLVQLSGEDGSHVWSKSYGSPEDDGTQAGGRLSVDRDNNLLFPFSAGGPVDFGGGPTPSGGTLYVKMKWPPPPEAQIGPAL